LTQKDNPKEEASFLESQLLISEVARISPHLAAIVKDIIFQAPSKGLRKSAQKVYSDFEKLSGKDKWICQHAGCQEKSVSSHEISESQIVKFLANKKETGIIVDVLKPFLKENPYKLEFKETAARSASAFPGYCDEHDRELFRDLDQAHDPGDDILLNKQFMRTTRREIYEVRRQIEAVDSLLTELREFAFGRTESDELMVQEVQKMEQHKKNAEGKLANWEQLYEKILQGIETRKPAIVFKKYEVKKRGYMFSASFDFSEQSSSDLQILFLLKKDFETQSFLYIATLKEEGLSGFDDLTLDTQDGRIEITNMMLGKKERFVFSPEFKDGLQEASRTVFCRSADFGFDSIDPFLIESELFSK